MAFYLHFENSEIGILSPANIDSFSFACGIFKLYSACKVTVRDVTKKFNNVLKTGMPVDVVFIDNDIDYVNKMKILSFNKYTDTSSGLVDFIDIILVNSIKFENKITTASYAGTTSTIIEDIITSKYSTLIGKSYDIEKTEDLTRRRYQLSESTPEFLQRIIKYGIKDNLPVYLYFNSKGVLNLKSISNMFKASPHFILTSMLAEQTFQIAADGESLNKKLYLSHSLSTNGKGSYSVIYSQFVSDNFRNNDIIVESLTSSSVSCNNTQSYNNFPTKVVFYPWNLTPNDAVAIAAKESFEETINTYSAKIVLNGFIVNDFNLGDVVYLILPYTPSAISNSGKQVNIGEGKYLITDVTYTFVNSVSKTTISLVQVAS